MENPMRDDDLTRRDFAARGMPKPEFMQQHIAAARSFKPMTIAEMDQLRAQVASTKVQIKQFFYHHYDSSRV